MPVYRAGFDYGVFQKGAAGFRHHRFQFFHPQRGALSRTAGAQILAVAVTLILIIIVIIVIIVIVIFVFVIIVIIVIAVIVIIVIIVIVIIIIVIAVIIIIIIIVIFIIAVVFIIIAVLFRVILFGAFAVLAGGGLQSLFFSLLIFPKGLEIRQCPNFSGHVFQKLRQLPDFPLIMGRH
ncbi:MAG: hypothetical protein LBL26_05890 [Peptococcaceae bacterium]|nr:hypothetical protein [Peptococcaceae bacterium]